MLGGCTAQPLPSRKLSDAEKKLIEICKNEYKFDVVLKSLDNTVWIYLPKTESFLDLKANENFRALMDELAGIVSAVGKRL
mgnify:CR=1 FL=1